ncbi:MAG TPA: acetolactate synthase small subunit [Acidimicrobiales bacterium]|nr:acetolactate synthase small subunit [Acidimicrobiales bacterium]
MSAVAGAPARGGDDRVRHHLVALLVENKAGVLARIAGLFSRRGFNIFSLAVAPTHDPRFSRVSIVVDVESAPLQQVVDQLDKLVNVVEITELHPDDAREAELLLVTVSVDEDDRAEVEALASAGGGSVVDAVPGAVTVMLAADPAVVDDFEDAMREHGIVELQRTGRIALPKLSADGASGA